jgi:hypothetical protein
VRPSRRWDQFDAAFPGATLELQLSAAGPTPIPPTPITLNANYTMLGTPVDMNAGNPHLKYYNQTLFFAGTLPLWNEKWTAASNVSQNAGRDQYVTLTPVDAGGALASPITVKAYTCAEFSQRVPCGMLAAPPPPANWSANMPVGIYGRRRLAQAATDTQAQAPQQQQQQQQQQPQQQQNQQPQQQQQQSSELPVSVPAGGTPSASEASAQLAAVKASFVMPNAPITPLTPAQEKQLFAAELAYVLATNAAGGGHNNGQGQQGQSQGQQASQSSEAGSQGAQSGSTGGWSAKWANPGDWNNSVTWEMHAPPAQQAPSSGGSGQAASTDNWRLPQAPTGGTRMFSTAMGGGGAPGAAPGGIFQEEEEQEVWSEWEPLPGSVSPADAAAMAQAPDQCVGYFRQVSFLSSLTLTAELSGVNSTWALTQAPCATEYVTATVPVSVHVFDADMYPPGNDPDGFVPMAWCQAWPLHVETPPKQPTVVVRGTGDPYLVAGEVTECTWDFARPVASDNQGERLALAATGAVAAFLVAAALCACAAINMRKRVDYGPLLRDLPERRAKYGAVDTSESVAHGGDISLVTVVSRPAAAAVQAQAAEAAAAAV